MTKQFVSFLSVGLGTMGLYYLILFLALSVAHCPDLIGVSIAYLISVGFHYNMNKWFTFSAKKNSHRVTLIRYLIVNSGNFLILLIFVKFFDEVFSVSAYISSFLSLTITTLVGFLAGKYWIFKQVKG